MATARMTLMGLYNFDNTLFQGIELPEGLDGDILAPELLQRCGSFELLYPNLEYMKFMIPWWFAKHNDTFTRWIAALNEEYDPLYNFDGHEEIRDEERYSNGKSHDVTATTSGSHDATSTTTNLQNEKSVSAYDSSTYQPKEKDVQNGSVRDAGTTSGSTRDAGSENETGSKTFIHTLHKYGNQGVTTSQQMLREELEIRRFNIYTQIADMFVDDFCIQVY